MSRNFRLKVIIRILIITCILALLIYYLLLEQKYLRSVYLVIFVAIALFEFIYFIDKTNRNFTSFLTALLQNDFTTTFSESGNSKSFNELHRTYNQITNKFRQINSEKEMHHLYLEALVEHISVGILSYDKNEKIHLINQAFKDLLDRPQLLYLSGLQQISNELFQAVRALKPGEHQLIKLNIHNKLLHVNIHASEFILKEKYHKLISFQNIKNELDANEMEAWQKLIRVLTHEIMNSVTPISSLSDTLYQITSKEEPFKPEVTGKILQGLDAIRNRSIGLQSFTQAYRSLTQVPTPKFENIQLDRLINNVLILLQPHLNGVDLKFNSESTPFIATADPKLLEQVLINLIKNALEAMEDQEKPVLTINLFQRDESFLEIRDNGKGITPDKLDQIFIPFFTTKKNGSGIGLALSQQIVRLHNGTLSAVRENDETIFRIEL
ncbi:sensor histidine kinase [Fulvivirga ligni]|uniref:sensor histidine kinase n=1 Tax=Fulvivirga ligni TaxID=2904246 RepID=UPI001F25F25D|nr:ATP-binding protein [Fulvivirga ligni]UII23116.1 ATP-binding protein [Fulvivirga ligni]